MSARRPLGWLVCAVALCLALPAPASADSADFKVIVHPDNPIGSLDRGFLRNAYLKKTSDWKNGSTIRPVDLGSRFASRDRFAREVLKKSPSQLRSYWSQRVFSGKGVPPLTVDSTAAAVAYVLANPGAVAYVPLDADIGRAKVVALR